MRDLSQHQVGASGKRLSGTVNPTPGFNADKDAEVLMKAMKGFGTDEDAIINVLGHRTNWERQEIAVAYKSNYGKDLVKDLISELSGKFEKTIVMLMMRWDIMLATQLYRAMKGAGTNEDVLIQVLCTLTNSEMYQIKSAYKEVLANEGIADPSRNLEKDIDDDVDGYLQNLLVALLQGNRREEDPESAVTGFRNLVDMNLVKADCESLYNAGEGKLGTDEMVFITILANRSKFHLKVMNEYYEKEYGTPLVKAIENEMSGDLREALKLTLEFLLSSSRAFARLLKKSMAGLGTNDEMLMRIIVSRSEIDMVQIKAAFAQETGQSLAEWIKGDTSGDYEKILLCLIGEK